MHIFLDMARSADIARAAALGPNELSLFDPENVQELAVLRRRASPPAGPPEAPLAALERPPQNDASGSDADRLFERFKIDERRKDWQLGALDIDVIHRGRIRIAANEWPPAIMYCKRDLIESNIVKQFRLHVLKNSPDVGLIYGTYRFKQKIAKAWLRDYHGGKFIDAKTNIRETMINLAYWLTAQQHAEKNYATWEGLIEEALTKLGGPS